MNAALNKAEKHIEMGIIQGAIIAVDNELAITQKFNDKIAPLKSL